MKAIVYKQYGTPDMLKLQELQKPTPKAGEVLIKVMAVGLNAADWRFLRGDPVVVRLMAGFFKPKHLTLGADVAGRVETVGNGVTHFRPGDDVYGDLSDYGFGGLAEYVSVPEMALARKPTNLSFKEAAAVPLAACTALQGLRDVGQLQRGQKVLIYGASGGVGTFAIQIAKALGAEVTAVCSTAKLEQARALGADYVIDYTREDFAQNGRCYNLILAANGNRSLADYERALTPQGIYVMAGGAGLQIFQAIVFGPLKSKAGGKTFRNLFAKTTPADLKILTELIEAGHVKPVMDKAYALTETPDAFRYLETGRARGKVVITVAAA